MLKGRKAIVTGSTSGIGLGIARALAAQGVDLMLSGFGDPAAIETLRAGLAAEFGVTVAYDPADLSQTSQCESLIDNAHFRLGGLHIVVNNAGIQHIAAVESFPPERWDAVIAVNLSSAFHTIRAALPALRAARWGRLINVASAHGLVASPYKSAYVAAKHGLLGLTKVVALETAGSGVTCNAICPGWVLTPLVKEQIAERARRKGIPLEQAEADLLEEKQPSGRFTTVEQIGALAVFLCGEGADNMTGAALPIDGGWTAR